MFHHNVARPATTSCLGALLPTAGVCAKWCAKPPRSCVQSHHVAVCKADCGRVRLRMVCSCLREVVSGSIVCHHVAVCEKCCLGALLPTAGVCVCEWCAKQLTAAVCVCEWCVAVCIAVWELCVKWCAFEA
jgi:hypothetical protein